MRYTDFKKQDVLVENSLYTTQAEKDALLKDKQLLMDSLIINYFGFLGNFKFSAVRGPMQHYSTSEGKLIPSMIGDDNRDVSLSIKMALDAGLLTTDAANKMTRLLAKIKQKTLQPAELLDATVRTDILPGVKYTAHRPSVFVLKAIQDFATGTSDLKHLAKSLYMVVRSHKKTFMPVAKEFYEIANSFKPYYNGLPDVVAHDLSLHNTVSVATGAATTQTTAPVPVAPQPTKPIGPTPEFWREFLAATDEPTRKAIMKKYSVSEIDKSKLVDTPPELITKTDQLLILVRDQATSAGKFLVRFIEKALRESNTFDEFVSKFPSHKTMEAADWTVVASRIYDLNSDLVLKAQILVKKVLQGPTTSNINPAINNFTRFYNPDYAESAEELAQAYVNIKQNNLSFNTNTRSVFRVLVAETPSRIPRTMALYGRTYTPQIYKDELKQLPAIIQEYFAMTGIGILMGVDAALDSLGSVKTSDDFFGVLQTIKREADSTQLSPSNIEKVISAFLGLCRSLSIENLRSLIDPLISRSTESIAAAIRSQKTLDELSAIFVSKDAEIKDSASLEAALSVLQYLQSFQAIGTGNKSVASVVNAMPNLKAWYLKAAMGRIVQGQFTIFPNSSLMEGVEFPGIMNNVADALTQQILASSDPNYWTAPGDLYKLEPSRYDSLDINKVTQIYNAINKKVNEWENKFSATYYAYGNAGQILGFLADQSKNGDEVVAIVRDKIVANMKNGQMKFWERNLLLKMDPHFDWPESELSKMAISTMISDAMYKENEGMQKELFRRMLNPVQFWEVVTYTGENINYIIPDDISSNDVETILTHIVDFDALKASKTWTSGGYKDKYGQDLVKATNVIHALGDKTFDGLSVSGSKSHIVMTRIAEILANATKIDRKYREAVLHNVSSLFTNAEVNPNSEAAFAMFDTQSRKKLAVAFANKVFAVYAIEDINEGGLVKPRKKVLGKSALTVLKLNRVSIPTSMFDFRKLRGSTLKDVQELAKNAVATNKIEEQKIEEIPMSNEDLEKMSVKYNLFNRYMHGGIAIQIRKAYKVNDGNSALFDAYKEDNKSNPRYGDSKTGYVFFKPQFHGTSSIATSMILRYGFSVVDEALARDAGIKYAGRMLGDGIYSSNVLDKVSQYVNDDASTGVSRKRGVVGYVMEIQTQGSSWGNSVSTTADWASAGTGYRYENRSTVSPEWAWRNPEKQIKILYCYEVEIIDKSDMDKLVQKHKSILESFDGAKEYLLTEKAKKQVNKEVKRYATFTFMDNVVPTISGQLKDIEDIKPSDVPGAIVEMNANGACVMFEHNEDIDAKYLFGVGLLTNQAEFKLYKSLMKK